MANRRSGAYWASALENFNKAYEIGSRRAESNQRNLTNLMNQLESNKRYQEEKDFQQKKYQDSLKQQQRDNFYREEQQRNIEKERKRQAERADVALVNSPEYNIAYLRKKGKHEEADALKQQVDARSSFREGSISLLGISNNESFNRLDEIKNGINEGKELVRLGIATESEIRILSDLQKKVNFITENSGKEMPVSDWENSQDRNSYNRNVGQIKKLEDDLIKVEEELITAMSTGLSEDILKPIQAKRLLYVDKIQQYKERNKNFLDNNRYPTFDMGTEGESENDLKIETQVEPKIEDRGDTKTIQREIYSDPMMFQTVLLENPDLVDALDEELKDPNNQDLKNRTDEIYSNALKIWTTGDEQAFEELKKTDVGAPKPSGLREKLSVAGQQIQKGVIEDKGVRIDPSAKVFKLPPKQDRSPEYFKRTTEQIKSALSETGAEEGKKTVGGLRNPLYLGGNDLSKNIGVVNKQLEERDIVIKNAKLALKAMPKTKQYANQVAELNKLIKDNPSGKRWIYKTNKKGKKELVLTVPKKGATVLVDRGDMESDKRQGGVDNLISNIITGQIQANPSQNIEPDPFNQNLLKEIVL
tara:strand:- start:945 stop:2711 length:1767 start_codon:yes stop_codon:yes gene_type:complete